MQLNRINYGVPVIGAAAPTPLTDVSQLQGPDQIFGLQWDAVADSYTRTGALTEKPNGQSPGNEFLPIHRRMRRCVLSDAGVGQYYLNPTNSSQKEGGDAADLTGGDGQVMVEIPKIYYRFNKAGDLHTWEISSGPQAGFSVHPAFSGGGEFRYFSAFEGWVDGANKLCSVTAKTPTTSKKRSDFRTYSAARGSGWSQQDFWMSHLIQLLFAIEYADFDSQAMISQGNTKYASWPGSPPSATGLSTGDGNGSGGQATAGGDPGDYMTYRGIENWFGHIWKWVDGFNVHNSTANGSRAYVCGDPANFADDTDSNYDLVGTLAQADGYFRDLAVTDGGLFLPGNTSGGSSATFFSDYYWTYYDNDPDIGWRVCRLGATASHGLQAGAFLWHSYDGSADASSNVGGRLCF